MAVTPTSRLARLLALYWLGEVTQGEAAKEVGLRKESFAELADFRMIEAALQREANRCMSDAFHRVFPECDADAVREGSAARRMPATNPREGRKASKRDVDLVTPPQRRTMRELVPKQRKSDPEVAAILKANRRTMWKRFVEAEPEGDAELELRLAG